MNCSFRIAAILEGLADMADRAQVGDVDEHGIYDLHRFIRHAHLNDLWVTWDQIEARIDQVDTDRSRGSWGSSLRRLIRPALRGTEGYLV